MELRINEYQVTPEITFNFDELKSEVAERVSYYKDLVYTDDQITEAKADRAKLRKIIEAIDGQRKQVKADLLQPYTELEKKLDEIKALIQEPINMIDNQVKAYEELQKETKSENIRQTWESKGAAFDLFIIWNPKWLNATYSMKKITDEMDEAIEKYRSGMEALQRLTEYSFEGIEVFQKTLDLGQAMVHVNDLKEQARRKAEFEAQKNTEPEVSHETADLLIEEERGWLCFEAYMTYDEALKLKEFFNTNNIKFRKGK